MKRELLQILRKKRHERGQVLILGFLVLLILIVGILVLFDVQRVIRGKAYTMTGIDAAALTGANWQKHSLNLIGELNMVKACTLLISDADYGIGKSVDEFLKVDVDDKQQAVKESVERAREEFARLQTVSDTLCQMQLRISFVGPLVGFGAAQQAAKNNRLSANKSCALYLEKMLQYIREEDFYTRDEFLKQVYFGYAWREPYANMIQDIRANGTGVAVGTNVSLVGLPALYTDPPTTPNFLAYLRNRTVLEAIKGRDWCLIQVLLDAQYGGKWWGNIKRDTQNQQLLTSSELLSLNIAFLPERPQSDLRNPSRYENERQEANELPRAFEEAVKPLLRDGQSLLTDVYNEKDPVDKNDVLIQNPADEDLKFNPLPALSWAVFGENWVRYKDAGSWRGYLRSDFREGADYTSGALSYFAVEVPISTLTGRYDFGKGLRFGHRRSFASRMTHYGERTSQASREILNDVSIAFDATAKPFGVLKTEKGRTLPPFAAKVILPVFEKATLVPVSLECPDGMPMYDYAWVVYVTKYLPAVGQSNTIDGAAGFMEGDEWALVQKFVDCWRLLENPSFRQDGLNWLNAEATGYNEYDENGNFVRHVTTSLNRDHCNDWGGGSGSGPRRGPGKLH